MADAKLQRQCAVQHQQGPTLGKGSVVFHNVSEPKVARYSKRRRIPVVYDERSDDSTDSTDEQEEQAVPGLRLRAADPGYITHEAETRISRSPAGTPGDTSDSIDVTSKSAAMTSEELAPILLDLLRRRHAAVLSQLATAVRPV